MAFQIAWPAARLRLLPVLAEPTRFSSPALAAFLLLSWLPLTPHCGTNPNSTPPSVFLSLAAKEKGCTLNTDTAPVCTHTTHTRTNCERLVSTNCPALSLSYLCRAGSHLQPSLFSQACGWHRTLLCWQLAPAGLSQGSTAAPASRLAARCGLPTLPMHLHCLFVFQASTLIVRLCIFSRQRRSLGPFLAPTCDLWPPAS